MAKTRASGKCVNSFFWGKSQRTAAKGVYKPWGKHIAPGCVGNVKLVPQAVSPGYVNRYFSQEDWECVSVGHLCKDLGVGLCQKCLSGCYCPLELKNASPLGHQGQANKGHMLAGLHMLAGFNRLLESAGVGGGFRKIP